MGEHTHFTVVFERPEGYEDVHVDLCAEDFINPPSNVRYEWFDGNLAQQRDELADALEKVCTEIVMEASVDFISARHKARAALAKYRQPQEVPEMFPGTLEQLRGLGIKK